MKFLGKKKKNLVVKPHSVRRTKLFLCRAKLHERRGDTRKKDPRGQQVVPVIICMSVSATVIWKITDIRFILSSPVKIILSCNLVSGSDKTGWVASALLKAYKDEYLFLQEISLML
jgi:hypothetical protein